MTFYEVVRQVLDLLQQQGRISYRALKREFGIDDDFIEDLKEELFFSHPVVDEDSRGLVWTGEPGIQPEPASTSQPDQTAPQHTAQEEPPTQIASSSPEPHAPDAERRQLTILFTDLVDSTALSGQLDAEDYREIVRAYQAACAEVIERFECILVQHLGDGLLVYSGYPVAHENDAERAVRAGLGILDAMKSLNERLAQEKGIRLGVRVALHTGQVVVGDVGAGSRHEQLALGEVPNVAARIQGLAAPDTVVISAATYQLVEGYFDCESLGEHALRGVAEPIAIHRVLRESGIQSRLDVASTRGLTPLVGREQEVGLLIDRWAQSREGHGQVILLSGEAGIGKSRLVQVLKEHAANEPHTRLECRNSPYFTNSALHPIIDMVQRTLRFQTDDTPETKLEKLEQNLSQYHLPTHETVPLCGTLLSLPVPEDRYPPLNLSPQRQRQKTLESIVAILLEHAEQQPVLFILEDLHWTDPSTLELLDLLIDQIPTVAIYTLLTCRPTFQPSWSSRSYLTQVTLSHLSHRQTEQLATQVAGGKTLPTDIVQQLVDKTDGVPLFVEEMTKSVLESGVLKEADGQYELVDTVSSLAIPTTLQDSLMARLDRLVTAKAVAQYASVIGRQFSFELLHAVSELDEATLRRELSRLVEAELVYQRGLPPQATYVFKHALIVEVSYQSLLRSTRQGYHRRIAEVLEGRFPETAESQPELMAHHYTNAGLNQKAVAFWKQAGERAVERSANAEAIEHYTKALEVLKTLPDAPERTEHELELLIALGAPLMVTHGTGAPEAEHVYAQARILCQKVQNSPHMFPALWGYGRVLIHRVEYQVARELGEQLVALAERSQEPARLLEAHFALGAPLLWMGKLDVSLRHMETARSFYETRQHRSLMLRSGHDHEVGCLTYEARALWFLGYPNQALTRVYEALDRARNLSHPFSMVRALCLVTFLHQYRQEMEQVRERGEELITIARAQDFAMWVVVARIMLGWTLALEGQENGIAEIQQGLKDYLAMGSQNGYSYHLSLLTEAYIQVEKPEEGLTVLQEALSFVEKTGERVHEADLYRLKGQLLLQQSMDNHTEAASCFHQAIAIAQSQSAKSWELRAATSLAKLWQSHDKRKEAYDLLAPVYGWFTEGFDTADLQDAKALLDALA
jgi:class 3 adenylate cyclase/predicted ATPase